MTLRRCILCTGVRYELTSFKNQFFFVYGICALFNNAYSRSEYVASHDRMINE
jgi:hypothetical protein